MKKSLWKRGIVALLALSLGIQAPVGNFNPILQSYAYNIRTATINASTLNVRSGAGTSYTSVAVLPKGTQVTTVGETTNSSGELWYQISFTYGGVQNSGYVLGTYIRFLETYTYDSDFESALSAQGFSEDYKEKLRQLHAQYPSWTFEAQHTGLDWSAAVENQSILGRNLVHTNSISSFKSTEAGAFNWDDSTWTGFDGSSWVAASEDVVSYYMDPRNFLDDVYVFQFLLHQYDPTIHTVDGLKTILSGTFMESNFTGSTSTDSSSSVVTPDSSSTTAPGVGVAPGGSSETWNSAPSSNNSNNSNIGFSAPVASISKNEVGLVATTYGPGGTTSSSGTASTVGPGMSSDTSSSSGTASFTGSTDYATVIMNAAAQSGVNPYVLAAMIIQEQGSAGQSSSISGTYSGYAGYYNYFNIEAYQSGSMSAIERGLWYASESGTYSRPWNTPEKSIVGGAQFYGTSYVDAGQDTFYLKKFNVQGTNMYKHQYMTNVEGAASEAVLFAEAYTDELKNSTLHFKIPVYNNMPAAACSRPVVTGSPNNKLGTLGIEGFTLTPTFERDYNAYDLIVDDSITQVNVFATVLDSTAQVSGIGSISLQSGTNQIRVAVTAENGSVREYLINVVRQSNGPTYNGSINQGAASSQNTSSGTSSGTSSTVGPGGITIFPTDTSTDVSSEPVSPTNGNDVVQLIGPMG